MSKPSVLLRTTHAGPIGQNMLYVVFSATFAVAYALSSRALRSHERAAATKPVEARSVPTWLAASVWSLVAAVAVTAPVDALSSLVVARAAA